MQFLWGLLPGAREARNDLAIGYAWLIALALFVDIPSATDDSNLGRLIDQAGPLAVGIALSFAAALVGSVLSEIARERSGVRGSRSRHEGETAEQAAAIITERAEEATRLSTLREQYEATSDRLAAEFILRIMLLPPLAAAAVRGIMDGEVVWAVGSVVAGVALAVQARRRHGEFNDEQERSKTVLASLNQLRG
jgi:hypothetical protein